MVATSHLELLRYGITVTTVVQVYSWSYMHAWCFWVVGRWTKSTALTPEFYALFQRLCWRNILLVLAYYLLKIVYMDTNIFICTNCYKKKINKKTVVLHANQYCWLNLMKCFDASFICAICNYWTACDVACEFLKISCKTKQKKMQQLCNVISVGNNFNQKKLSFFVCSCLAKCVSFLACIFSSIFREDSQGHSMLHQICSVTSLSLSLH